MNLAQIFNREFRALCQKQEQVKRVHRFARARLKILDDVARAVQFQELGRN